METVPLSAAGLMTPGLKSMNHKIAILYGIAIWAFVFTAAMLIFPLRANERPLFESIMPVALTFAVTAASVKYFQKSQKRTLMIGFCLGLIWVTVNLAIDMLMFSWGPMKMSISDYLEDIGLTYLMMPIITTGLGYIYEKYK